MSRVLSLAAALLVAATTFAFAAGTALAHERRQVGPYTFAVGWLTEPAYVNTINGLDLTVTESATGKAVEGLDKTLQAEVIVGGGAKKLPLDLAARFGQPGKYQGQFMPTKDGDYIFHITGTAGSTKVDERFESGPNTFEGIASTDPLQFPDKLRTTEDLDRDLGSVRGFALAALALAIVALASAGLRLRGRR